MWPFLLRLGIAAMAGLGLGMILLLNQESSRREIPYDRNWRESDYDPTPEVEIGDRDRKRRIKEKRKDEESRRKLLEDQLNSGTAECVICTEIMTCVDNVWPCPFCRNIFHLHCISHWAEIDRRSFWKCPVCREEISETYPLKYTCMCGRIDSPESLPGITPHCCGQKCMRRCGNRCHPGPCSRRYYE